MAPDSDGLGEIAIAGWCGCGVSLLDSDSRSNLAADSRILRVDGRPSHRRNPGREIEDEQREIRSWRTSAGRLVFVQGHMTTPNA